MEGKPLIQIFYKGNIFIRTAVTYAVFIFLLNPAISHAQNSFESMIIKKMDSLTAAVSKENYQAQLYPNTALQAMMIVSGWGGYGSLLFGSIGGAYPQVYRTAGDLAASAGFCIGNPIKFINFAASININDVSEFDNYSANFSISKSISRGSSITVGGFGLFASKESDAPEATYYFAFSHSVQTLPSKTPYTSKLSYTLGIGNGRFLLKSEEDIWAGKGKYGTGVFGSISYELLQNINLNAEWDGLNLGLSLGAAPFKKPLTLGIGITNLTGYSGDKPNFEFAVDYAVFLNKIKN